MIRIRPQEWLHMEVKGSGRMGNAKVAGTLYVTPKRVVIQGKDGPLWESPLKDLTVKVEGRTNTLATRDGREVTWTSKIPVAWWGNAIRFWKRGIIQNAKPVDGPPPSFGEITELPDVLRNTPWNVRWYDTLAEEGIPGDIPQSDEFLSVSRRTNIILAALRHDGFPDGPPPAFYVMMLRRHALTHITNLVWSWRNALRYLTAVVTGRGRDARADKVGMVFASWPDRLYAPKPFTKPDWYQQMNPACCGGHPYQMIERCRMMIPIVTRVADELHEHQGHNPYLRMRQLFEAILDDKPLPPPPREALRLARAATNNPW